MKQKLFSLLLMAFIPIAMMAEDVTIDGINYSVIKKAKQAEVIKWTTDKYEGNITIPDAVVYDGITYSVTSIGNFAFLGCSGLTSVTIPSSVTSIGNRAFYNCSGLTSVTMPNVTSIGEDAFYGCSGLTSITMPNVTSIGKQAFYNCGLNNGNITIGCKLNSFGENAFYYGQKQYILNINIVIDDEADFCSNNPIQLLEEYVSISTVKIINQRGEEIKEFVIPPSVTSIGNYAFYYCSGLTSITIPEGVTSIGNYAFSECSGLTSVTIPEGVTSIGNKAFAGCSGLTSITIHEGVTSIGYNAFSRCSGLTSITIPEGVTSIGYGAFHQCTGLTSITLPSSVVSIGTGVCELCPSLTSIHISDLDSWLNKNFASNPLSYAHHLFLNNVEITEIVFPEGMTTIGNAFSGCTGLTSVTIPSSVTSIGNSAFRGCSGLTSITIPESVTSIGESAFSDCSGLTSLSIPNSVTSIGYSTFSGCTGLTSVSIPSSVTSIGTSAFFKCSGLTSISIPSSVTSIGSDAFANCEGLEVVTCLATTVPSTKSAAFANSYVEYATLKVPASAIETYRTTEPWSNFGTIEALDDEVIITVTDCEREYGEPNPQFDYTVVGSELIGEPVFACEADENSPAGTYTIEISQGSVSNASVTLINGTLTVTKAPLTITAKDYTVTVGDAMPTFEAEYEGFKNSDDETILTTAPSFSCAATNTDTEGIYDITVSGAASDRYDITYAKGQLAIVPTEVVITISSAGMATYCSPYDLDFSGVKNLKAYIISGYDWANKKVFATRVYDVPAGTGLYLVAPEGEYHVNICSTSCYYINMLVGTTSSITLEPTDGDVTNLILTGTSPQNASFKTLAASRTFGANKAYLQIPTSVLSSSANAVGIIFDDETNGIESISGMGHANGDWFTIDGRRLNSMPVQKGVYILNGNKIVIK